MFGDKFKDSFKIYWFLHVIFVAIVVFAFFLLIHFKNQSLERAVKMSNLHKDVKTVVETSQLLKRKNVSNEELNNNLDHLISINKEVLGMQSLLGEDELHEKRAELFESFSDNQRPEFDLSKSWFDYVEANKSFLKFVQANYWKTLTGISKRIVARTDSRFDWNRFPFDVIKNNSKDYQQVLDVTKASALKEESKVEIENNIKELSKRLEIVKNELIKSRPYRENYNEFMRLTEKWVQRWNKSSQRVLTPRFDFMSVKDFLTLAFVILLSLILFYVLGKKVFLYNKGLAEQESIDQFNRLILKDDIKFIEGGSFEYQNTIKSLREYLKKKLSFSRIFQKSVPFPALLLDEKMNLKWKNEHFDEFLNIDDNNILKKLDDSFAQNISSMIQNTFESNLPSIYKVKNKKDQSFQIYITPVESYSVRFVMISFTSLGEVEGSISIHASSLLESLDHILENLEDESFNPEDLSNEFSKKEVNLLYEKLLDFVSYRNNKSLHLQKNVSSLNSDVEVMKEALEKINNLNSESLDIYSGLSSKFLELKNTLTDSVEMNETLYLHQLQGSQLIEELGELISSPSHLENVNLYLEKSLEVQKKFAEYEEEVIILLKSIVDSTKQIGGHLSVVSENIQEGLNKSLN